MSPFFNLAGREHGPAERSKALWPDWKEKEKKGEERKMGKKEKKEAEQAGAAGKFGRGGECGALTSEPRTKRAAPFDLRLLKLFVIGINFPHPARAGFWSRSTAAKLAKSTGKSSFFEEYVKIYSQSPRCFTTKHLCGVGRGMFCARSRKYILPTLINV